MILGEAPGAHEEAEGKPFVGVSGQELGKMLQEAGLLRAECYLTNVVKFRPPLNVIDNFIAPSRRKLRGREPYIEANGRWCTQEAVEGLSELRADINAIRPNVIIALGDTALWALTGNSGITSWRGSIMQESLSAIQCKVVPTYHPAAVLRMWEWRAIAVHDLRRAKIESETAAYIAPSWNFTLSPSFEAVMSKLNGLLEVAKDGPLTLAVDIETRGGQIACIGIAWTARSALCIPLLCTERIDGYWSREEELAIVLLLRSVLTHRNVYVVGHNFLYDVQYFAQRLFFIPNCTDDTMFQQHVAFVGLPKSLAFVASMYCSQYIYWKEDGKEWDPSIPEDKYWAYNCLTGDTLVLDAYCQWKPLKDVDEGTWLLTFEENPSGKSWARRLRFARVTKRASSRKNCIRVTFNDGSVITGTPDHKMLVQKVKTNGRFIGLEWKELHECVPGTILPTLGKPWKAEDSYEVGWMSGILDGEGTVGVLYEKNETFFIRPGFSQKRGLVFDYAYKILEDRGFSLRISDKANATYVDVNGGLAEALRLLGMFPTRRLQQNVVNGAATHGWSGISCIPRKTVVSVEDVGEQEVFDITTTQGTFIANGFIAHNCTDACRTFEAYIELSRVIHRLNLSDQYRFQMRLWHRALRAMLRGVRINQHYRNEMLNELLEASEAREKLINIVVGYPLNPRSPKQMHHFLYEELGLPPVHNRKTGKITANFDAMQKCATREPLLNPIVTALLEQRTIGVYISTFVRSPLDSDGRIRCSFNPAGTETYRLSSSKSAFGTGMDLQNVPYETRKLAANGKVGLKMEMPNVRKMFVPDPGWIIADMDLDRADLQVVVWEANDSELMDALRLGADIHLLNGATLYGTKLAVEECVESHPRYADLRKRFSRERQFAKNFIHATNYGASPETAGLAAGVVKSVAARFQDIWFTKHPGIHDWHERVKMQLMTKRYVENRFGYRRFYFGRIDQLLPEALAWVPQSTVAIVINRAWDNIEAKFNGDGVETLLQVHDSLVFQLRAATTTDETFSAIHSASLIPIPYPQPLTIPVGLKTSLKSWGDCTSHPWPR